MEFDVVDMHAQRRLQRGPQKLRLQLSRLRLCYGVLVVGVKPAQVCPSAPRSQVSMLSLPCHQSRAAQAF
jgi:hypothetical protein